MVRISKQQERRNRSPRKHKKPSAKTGSKKDNLPLGYKERVNAVEGNVAAQVYVGKIS
ncbi:Uncharacterized protein SCG7086_BZ_00040 [Chlamydiales bacterium SCGC AG-110-P3]|nr:Uncharacterized protein SCG7086_BZ_00040 [Chlamydiales bacterium SCGC AG-110-P3]